MDNITFRLAKPSDAKQIAFVHYHVRDKYEEGFFAKVNYSFLYHYYKVILDDPHQVVVCAEDDERIVGFSSCSTDAKSEFKNLRAHKWSFVIPLITSAIGRPSIIKDALQRFKSTKDNSKTNFVHSEGARNEYWAWLPNREDSYLSLYTQEIMLNLIYNFGVKEIYGEVDLVNSKVLKMHKRNGYQITEQFTMPDGRERVGIVLNLDNHKFKLLK